MRLLPGVTEGTLEHLIEIDYILDQFSKVKVENMKPVIRNILRSGVYQLKYMDSVPDHAVCSEQDQTGSKKRLFRIKGVCERSAAECGKRTGYIGLSAGRN